VVYGTGRIIRKRKYNMLLRIKKTFIKFKPYCRGFKRKTLKIKNKFRSFYSTSKFYRLGAKGNLTLVEEILNIALLYRTMVLAGVVHFLLHRRKLDICHGLFHLSMRMEWNQVHYYCGHLFAYCTGLG
jgi:hypothetical protein